MGKMFILNHTGDEMIEWDVNDPNSIMQACEKFIQLRAQGYLIYRVIDGQATDEFNPESGALTARTKSGEQINEFDSAAEEVVAAPPLVGG